MIKLKDILLESDIFIPRRIEDRTERHIKNYIRNGSKDNLSLQNGGLTKLPDLLKYVKEVGGYFDCRANSLTSLEGSPQSVNGNFYCNNNKLTSLEGAPISVGGGFDCRYNKLTSLEGSPTSVVDSFDCKFNKLTSLKGAPQSVGGDFDCRNNPVKFTEEQVRAVCNVGGNVYV